MKLRSKSLRKYFPKKKESSRLGQFYNKNKIYNRAQDKKAYERDINLAED